jgi:hypothetical protein
MNSQAEERCVFRGDNLCVFSDVLLSHRDKDKSCHRCAYCTVRIRRPVRSVGNVTTLATSIVRLDDRAMGSHRR